MKYLALAIAVAGVATGLSVSSDPAIAPRSNAAVMSEVSEGEVFTLHARGSGETCVVRKSPGDGAVATVRVEPGCDDVLSGLSGVRYWQERDDGSIVLAGERSEAIVSFAVADGVAYESFAPRSPLISLIAEN